MAHPNWWMFPRNLYPDLSAWYTMAWRLIWLPVIVIGLLMLMVGVFFSHGPKTVLAIFGGLI